MFNCFFFIPNDARLKLSNLSFFLNASQILKYIKTVFF